MLKGMNMLSGVLFLAFIIAATAIVYMVGIPIIQNLQCTATLEKMKSSFIELDRIVEDVSSEGEGSKRTLNLNIDEGRLYFSGNNETIYWTYECSSPVYSPRTSQAFGNIVVGSNLDTSAVEGQCKGQTAFILENSHLKVCLKKIGSPSNLTSYNTSDVLLGVYQKDAGQWLYLKSLEITLDNDQTSATGMGYTKLENTGYHLPYGEVTMSMESDYKINYNIKFILESGEDFLIIRGA